MSGIRKMGKVIAVDGPAGTGKSSVTKELASRLGYVHVDTGALYRAIAWLSLDHGIDIDSDSKSVSEIAHSAHLEFKRDNRQNPPNRIFADGLDITSRIRTPEVSMAASKVSSYPEVRAALLGLQRRLGCLTHSILEGRDIGTVIFPDADVKFFLTASVEERARRRFAELQQGGDRSSTYELILSQITERDHQDSTRAVAPLKKADDAIEIDTSQLTLEEVVGKMEAIVRAKVG